MVLLTPFSQGTHLLSVGRLIVVGDQAYHRCVISKFDDDIGAGAGAGDTGAIKGIFFLSTLLLVYYHMS